MNVTHKIIGDYMLHYDFAEGSETLLITTHPIAAGEMASSMMFAWTSERKATATRIKEDPRYGIGSKEEVALTEFPLSDAITKIQSSGHLLNKTEQARMLKILQLAQSLAG